MKVKTLFLLCLMSISLSTNASKVYNLISGIISEKAEVSNPQIIVNATDSTYDVSIIIEEVEICEDSETGKNYVHIPGMGITNVAGEPALPYTMQQFQVQGQTSPNIEILNYSEKYLEINLAPGKPDVLEDELVICPPMQYFKGYSNNPIVKCKNIGTYRGVNIAYVDIIPAQYSIDDLKLKIFSKLEFRITDQSKSFLKAGESKTAKKSSYFNDFANDPILYNVYLQNSDNNTYSLKSLQRESSSQLTKTPDNEGYLIITMPDYVNSIENFANWKAKEGYSCHIVTRDTWDIESVKEEISTYASEDNNFTALLLVGDINQIPSFKQRDFYFRIYYSDMQYACLDGDDDNLPDVLYGRIPVSNSVDATNVFDKIVKYESFQYASTLTSDSPFSNAMHIGCFAVQGNNQRESRKFISTVESIRKALLPYLKIKRVYNKDITATPKYFNDGSTLPDELIYPDYLWDDNYLDIINGFNSGIGYVLYRGHGDKDSLDIPTFTLDNIDNLRNYTWHPIFFGITCNTGDFRSDCFGAKLLRVEQTGASTVLCASNPSLTYHNDSIAKGMLQYLYPEAKIIKNYYRPIKRNTIIGRALSFGFNYMRSNLSDEFNNDYQTRIYHWFGDPTMSMYTQNPEAINNLGVSLSSSKYYISTDNADLKISVVYSDGRIIAKQANKFEFDSKLCESITITGTNIIPKTITAEELESFRITSFESYLQSAYCRGSKLIILYNLSTLLSVPGFPTPHEGLITITKFDGTVVGTYSCSSDEHKKEISLSSLEAGMYTVTLSYSGQICGSASIRYSGSLSRL